MYCSSPCPRGPRLFSRAFLCFPEASWSVVQKNIPSAQTTVYTIIWAHLDHMVMARNRAVDNNC